MASIDLKKILKETAAESHKELSKLTPGSELVYLSVTGSHLHGTDLPDSDVDIKGLFCPSIKSLITNNPVHQVRFKHIVDEQEVEVVLMSVHFLLGKILQMECNAIEFLFSMQEQNENKNYFIKKSIADVIFKKRNYFLRKDYSSFVGMANAELKRFEHKQEYVKLNDRNTGKDIAHGLRSIGQAIQLRDQNKLTFPVKDSKLYKDLKLGVYDKESLLNSTIVDAKFYEMLKDQVESLEYTKEPRTADHQAQAEKIIMSIYKGKLK